MADEVNHSAQQDDDDTDVVTKKHVYVFVGDTIVVCTNKSTSDAWYTRSTQRDRFDHDYPVGGFENVMRFLETDCPRMEVVRSREDTLARLSSLHERGATSWDARLSPREGAERALQHLESCC